VVQNISDGLIIDDCEGRVVLANERFRQLFGVPAGVDVRQLRLEDYVAPEYRAELRDRHERRVRGEAVPDHYTYEALRGDGSRFWAEVDVTPVLVDGIITGTQSLNRDITGRKITEQAMLLLATGTATLRGQPFYEHIASEAARLFGADQGLVARYDHPQPDRVRTLGLWLDGRVLPPMEYTLAGTPCANVIANRCVVYPEGVATRFPADTLLREQGMEGYAAAPLHNPAGAVIGHVAILSRRPLRHSVSLLESVLQMIAFKVAAEIERQQAESKFRDLFAFAPDAIFIATQAGIITDANERAVEMFGYPRDEIAGLDVSRLISPEVRPELLRRLAVYLANPVPHAMGTSPPGLFGLSKTGRRFPFDISLSPLQSDHGLLVVAALRDTTAQLRAAEQRQQMESQLRQAQKMESLGTLAGGIAHDFNNILTGMLGFVELLHLDLPADHPAQQWIRNLSASGDRAKNLVRQILTFSRKQEGERLPLRLTAVAEEAIRLLRATIPAMIDLETDFPPACPPVMADSNQMHQVLVNLCTNAWHALPPKDGRIRVALDTCELPRESASPQPLQAPGTYVRLTVTDNGAGMDAHTLERIFDPFFTTKKTGEGTGLGLAVVHGIVQAHDGFIKVRSTLGKGTTFELFFPAIAPSLAAPPAAPAGRGPRGAGEAILLVDDDPAGGQALASLLEWLGYKATLHATPLSALEVFQAAPTAFALIISDLAMPGLTGIQFARQVRALNPAQPLLIISGYVTPAQQQELREIGVPEILRKPPTLDELTRAVARSLGGKPAG
jgi:PAS domain S-box-containing protein